MEAASFSIAIRERQEFTLVKRTGFSASLGPEKQYRPTDKLAIAVEKNSGGRFEFVDTTTMRVEQRLNDLFIRLYTTVVAARVADRVQKVNDRQRAIAKLAYEEITRQRAVDAQLKAEENARRKALAEESSSWHEAQRIRAYSTHVMNRAEDPQRPEVQQWFAWAMGVADQWDPTAKRVAWFAHPNNSETQTPKESSSG